MGDMAAASLQKLKDEVAQPPISKIRPKLAQILKHPKIGSDFENAPKIGLDFKTAPNLAQKYPKN